MDTKVNKTQVGTQSYPIHSHKRCEIMHYLSGHGVMKTEMGEIPFSAGTVIVIPRGIAHGSVGDGEFVNISVESDFDGAVLLDAPTAVECIGDDGERLVSMIWENRFGNEAYLSSLCTAYARYVMQIARIEGDMPRRVSAIIKSISENAYDAHIDVSGILRESGYAEDYVRAEFKKITGKTPKAFLTELRIKHACYLIDIYGSTLTLSEIAQRCGYTDYVYFSKKFKTITGASPEKYRRS